jgi:tRNA(Met) cytidine acetyltransferase
LIVAPELSVELVRTLWDAARASHHRRVLLLDGDAGWTASRARQAVAALPELTPVWLTERQLTERPFADTTPSVKASGEKCWSEEDIPPLPAPSHPQESREKSLSSRCELARTLPTTLPIRAAPQLLGLDLDLLIYDAHSGFDPDGFGASTGAIRGGGILILLTPPLADWPTRTDPEAGRIAVWPHSAESLTGRFIARLVRVLIADPSIVSVHQPEHRSARRTAPDPALSDLARRPLLSGPATINPPGRPSEQPTSDQQRAIDAILNTARGRARRPLVLTAHRGRGKSAALGFAAGQLLRAGACRILVTAPRRSAVAAVFRHAHPVAPAAIAQDGSPRLGELRFHSPDSLVADLPPADLLLVDEAAGIPAPLLATLLAHYPRIVFATTTHGYEGTGRGFEIRFRATLERLTPHWRALTLDTPIRWAPEDPLEALTFRALLLDAAPAADAQLIAAIPATCRCERLDPDRLARDTPILHELFGLLVLAHYQTRPMDLRMLLDGPNVRIYVLRHGERIAATLLAAEEGGFTDAGLRESIYLGRRRPRGHLLPQTLSAHAGLLDAPACRYLRVIRIAVHPALSGRGLGRLLLRALFREGRADGFDLAGASFGATPELLQFWDRCGYRPVQIGASRNAASGEHAVVVLRPLNAHGWRFAAAARLRLAFRLPVLLAGPLRALAPDVVVALLAALHAGLESSPDPEADESEPELAGFVSGHRTLDATLPLLAGLTRRHLGVCLHAGTITPRDAALLVATFCQLRPLAELVQFFLSPGRAALLTEIRRAAGQLRAAPRRDH